jgi:hypothetical protein
MVFESYDREWLLFLSLLLLLSFVEWEHYDDGAIQSHPRSYRVLGAVIYEEIE